MRKTELAVSLAALLAAGVAYAQQPPQEPRDRPGSAQAGEQTKQITAEVVSTDEQAKTITIKKSEPGMASPKETTLKVEASAQGRLTDLKPGESVKLTCKTDSSGKETAVTKIEKAEKKPMQ